MVLVMCIPPGFNIPGQVDETALTPSVVWKEHEAQR